MNQNVASFEQSLFVSINTDCVKGHCTDIRTSLNRALPGISHSIFQDKPKKPEHIFTTTVEEILLSNGILLDALSASTHDPDVLIQFGISYALGKKVKFLAVKNNSQNLSPITSKAIGNHYISFDYYLDLIIELEPRVSEWLNKDIVLQKIERNNTPVHAFSVLGVSSETNPDLYQTISDFSTGTDWKAKFYQEMGFISPLKDLAQAIGVRSFSMFCLSENANENLYVGIGLAIGLGVPFLILQPENIILPESLGGYGGIIKFSNQSQLEERLKKYSAIFLSEQVRSWDGNTFFQVLSQVEQKIEVIDDLSHLNKMEYLLHAINRSLRPNLSKPYELLGDVYREKVHQCYPHNIDHQQSIEWLQTAIVFYRAAIKIQSHNKRCRDRISATDKLIQIIEFLQEGKYRSIPQLIRLIGEDITAEQYTYLREYLLIEVEKLIKGTDFLNALALLAAISLHDKSERVMNLINELLAKAPETFLNTIHNLQDYIVVLEADTIELNHLLEDRNEKIEELSFYLNAKTENLLEAIEKIKDLEQELSGNLDQLAAVKAMNDRLDESVAQADVLKSEIEEARQLSGRGVLVNFGRGLGWAIYETLDGDKPYVVRDHKKRFAQKGMILIDNDCVYHSNGTCAVHLIPSGSTVIGPDGRVI